VTIDGQTHPLPAPFFVMATQNPIELEGTFPLPEAQLDRFLLKIRLGYPDRDEEIRIMERFRESDPLEQLNAVVTPDDITKLQQARRGILVSEPVRDYIADMVRATRDHPAVRFGASPRGSLGLMRAAQARATHQGRAYILPDDVKYFQFAPGMHFCGNLSFHRTFIPPDRPGSADFSYSACGERSQDLEQHESLSGQM